MTTETVVKGRWYPSPAPALDGEDDDAYTNRLTGAAGAGQQPYDHVRYRQCSIGWHMECSCRRGGGLCMCPCHADHAPRDTRLMPAWILDGAEKLAQLYSLPDATGLRVMAVARHAAGDGEDADPGPARRGPG